ncbi:class I SAM-dependent methyltransferase [Leptospira gomenensis]|uniref:Class I SAM-dependent methyltransferase n=1 Tax=Leptospira gomenensis TaxID=2484974 RepID=A0A5F1YRU4_9LEPT|nr:class I SAM-dependent methyltransferase [Leptospira gomenensis]TGK30898.1 class I SAM-dependent methyltransferase [Leptospira gomenensis]TGK32536.1 class I SAM-dependent methyltransferase [Leptospira gomenensis]TGK45382.1 class I SAM-dependent methyltransferase [Leptospira gomenensis]TGK60626.1 class I SAM-dependent methyltransferase [Leptospira gomenensis]
MNCRVCDESVAFSFRERVLGKYDVSYYYCDRCGALQTEHPYWLEEAYGDAIIDADTGLIRRNLYFSEMLSCILFKLFGAEGSYADIAGGYGMMTRLMRDRGFDYYWSDPYCDNFLAKGFEAEFSEKRKYDAVSAFEVLEHTVDPIGFIADTFQKTNADLIVFSTELFKAPAPKDWFYFAFEGGQHIVFFQKRTLTEIASRLNLRFYSNGTFHIFSKRRLSGLFLNLLRGPFRKLYLLWIRIFLKSKTMSDHYRILNKTL